MITWLLTHPLAQVGLLLVVIIIAEIVEPSLHAFAAECDRRLGGDE